MYEVWNLTAKDQSIILNALRVAADEYENDASVMEEIEEYGLAEQFRRQAEEARTLLKILE